MGIVSDYVIMCPTHLVNHYSHIKCVGCVVDALYDIVDDLIIRVEKLEENKNEND